jgi:hypothetical protein
VTLERDIGEMTLLPIAGVGEPIVPPSRFAKGTNTPHGKLVLGDFEPLSLLTGEAAPDKDVTPLEPMHLPASPT